MVLDALGESLKKTLKKIAGSLFVDEKVVNELVKDIQRALLQADVNVKLVLSLTSSIKKRILSDDIPAGLTKQEYLVTVVYEELTNFLGREGKTIDTTKKPMQIMLVGLFGNGKTTQAGKLAKYYQKRGLKIAMISTDTWRPAAFEQLKQVGAQISVPVFGDVNEKDPISLYKKFEPELRKFDLVIVDTAGRDALNDELVDELNGLNEVVKADERILVMAADVGQAAQKQAEVFHETVNITGVIITKLDGTAKGGGALSACAVASAPVIFIGVGEKIDDLELFDPKRFVGRLLGMGDIEGLLEKAKEVMSEEKAEDLGKRVLKGEFTLIDLYEQMEAMKSMGPLGKVMEMIPGMGQMKIPKEVLKGQEEKIGTWRYIMDSCTKEELEDPDNMNTGRIERVAKGSGCSISSVREMLKQYKQSKKMVKMMKGGGEKKMQKMMQQFQQGGVKFK